MKLAECKPVILNDADKMLFYFLSQTFVITQHHLYFRREVACRAVIRNVVDLEH